MGRRTHPTGWTVLFVRVGADSSASKWLCADCSLKQYAAEGKVLLLLRERGL